MQFISEHGYLRANSVESSERLDSPSGPYLRALVKSASALCNTHPDDAISTWLGVLCTSLRWAVGELWDWQGGGLRLLSRWHDGSPRMEDFMRKTIPLALRPDYVLPEDAIQDRKPVFVQDLGSYSTFKRAPLAAQFGLKCGLAIPIQNEQPLPMTLFLMDRNERTDVDAVTMCVQVACDELGLYLSRVNGNHDGHDSNHEAHPVNPRSPHNEHKILNFDLQMLDGPSGALQMSGIEWQVLCFLWHRRGVIVNRADLLEEFWGVIDSHSLASLYEIISRLRGHLRMVGLDGSIIRVIPKRGYSLELKAG